MENKTSIVIANTPELSPLEPSRAESISKTFEPMAAMLAEFESDYNSIVSDAADEITPELIGRARRLRLDLVKIRTGTGKIKDKQKEYIKLEDKAIMGVHNFIVLAVTEKEDKLKEIEKHFENLERERLEKLQRERVEMLSKYVVDASDRNLASMPDDVWEAYISTKQREHEDIIAAEKKAEEERIARELEEAKERERIRIENERLKAEAAERERLAKIEAEQRAKEDAERRRKEAEEQRKRDEAARIERERHEAELRRQREEHEAKLRAEAAERERIEAEKRKEREKREKLEAKIKSEKEAERKRISEEQKRLADAELQRNNRDEIIMGIMSLVDEEEEDKEVWFGAISSCVADAIIAGKIPHVKYVG